MSIIKEYAGFLKLPFIKNNYQECINEAHSRDMDNEEFLETTLKSEVDLRNENSIRSKIQKAKFPNKILLEDDEREHLSIEQRMKIKELETLEFIKNKENVILIGNPGTGKTALSVALGMKACMEGKNVLFVSVPTLLMEIKEAMNENQILKYKKKFEKYDLTILDELGYCTFSPECGEVLFNLLSSRNEKGAMIITSNLAFDQWEGVFNDKLLTGAIVDRLAFKSHLLNMSGKSYRVIATQKWIDKKKEGNS